MARCVKSILPNPRLVYPTTMIFDFIGRKSIVCIRTLIRKGVDIETKDSNGDTPLLFACYDRAEEIVSFLIKNDANVERKSPRNERTVFHFAAAYDWTEILDLLIFLNKGIDLNVRDVNGETPMHHGSKWGHCDVLGFLIKHGADIDCKNHRGVTPLLYAARCAYEDVFDLLINSKVNIDYLNRLLLYYALRNSWTKAVQLLVARISSLNKRFVMEKITLDGTSCGEHLDLVKYLLELCVDGTDANTENDMIIQAALFHASHIGHLEVVKWLMITGSDLKRVPDLNAKLDGCTALTLASKSGHMEIVKYLVEQGADVNIKDYMHETPLHYIAEKGCVDTTQFLIKKGCDLDAMNKEGRTSLMIACFSQHFETAHVLLHAGANWDTVDMYGVSPISFSTRPGQPHSKLIELLILHGAYLKTFDKYAIMENPSLEVLQDEKVCCQAIINGFNNHVLCKLYKLPASENLPRIEKMKIANGSEVAQAIERNVGFEIQTKGHCNLLEVKPMALSVFSVKSILKYYKENTRKLKSGLKRSAALDSLNNNQHSSKSIRLC